MLIIPLITARETKIAVKTDEKRFVFIQVDDSITQDKIQYVNLMTNADGVAVTNVSSDSQELDIFIRVTDTKGIIINSTKYTSYPAGENLVVDFQVKNETEMVALETNETGAQITEETETLEANETEIQETSQEITGKIVRGIFKDINASRIIYYIVGGFALIAIIGFITARRIIARKGEGDGFQEQKSFKIKKLTQLQAEQKEEAKMGDSDRIRAAEEKIREAQAELNRIKNDERIKEMEKKIEEDRQRLERLKAGED